MRLLAKIEHKKSPKAENHNWKLRRAEEELGGRNHGRLVALQHSTHSRNQFLTRGLPTRTCHSLFLASKGIEGGPYFCAGLAKGLEEKFVPSSALNSHLKPFINRRSLLQPTSITSSTRKRFLYAFSHLRGRRCSFFLVLMLIFNF